MENSGLLRKTYELLRERGYNLNQIAEVRGTTRVAVEHEMQMLGVLKIGVDFAAEYKSMDRKLDGFIAEKLSIRDMAGRLEEEESRKNKYEVRIGEREVYRLLNKHCKLEEYRKKHRKGSNVDVEEWERRRKILRRLAESGREQHRAAQALGVSGRERVRQLLEEYDLHELWMKNEKKNRERAKNEGKLEEYISAFSKVVLLSCCLKDAKSNWERDVAKYYSARDIFYGNERLERIMKLVKIYDGCVEEDRKMSFLEMGVEVGMNAAAARTTLAKIGRKSLNYSIMPHKKRRIK